MTIDQITNTVAASKPVSRRQVIRYLNDCRISPIGIRQRPQQYPADSADRILTHLGLGKVSAPKPARLPSMRELQNERKKARAK